jgi:glycosyltransferase involved in cell wall biosynthesis
LSAAYMSGSPFYPFPLTVFFARLLRLPSVIDFRDSWSFNHGFDGRRPDGVWGRLRERVFGIVERFSIKYASRVLFATPILEEEYADLFPEYRHKYFTVLNGYDPDDVADIGARRVSPRITLVLAGQFSRYVPHAVDCLMACLRHNEQLHFLYLGEEHALFANKAKQFDVVRKVTTLPRVSYQQALEFISGSDVALLATGLVNGVGTKIFDYLALEKPVLCLVPQGSNITRLFGDLPRVVISHPPHSASRLKEALEQTISSRNLPAKAGAMEEFTRPAAAAKLAGLLNELCRTS